MKPLILLHVLTVFINYALDAQDSTLKKKLSFKIWVTGSDNRKTVGWLSTISDSTLELSTRRKHFSDARIIVNNRLEGFDYSQVTAMKLKRSNGAGRGAVIGAVCGLLIGAIGGFIAGDDPHVPANQDFFGFGEAFRLTAAEKALIFGVAGGATGAGTGALIGSLIKQTFIIGGKKEKFSEMRANVLDKAYRHY